ncbi:two-component regulator propeller domain-containing protein [uncultured Bacteroides sp.]|uniref:hybrid sensor histidine kinase/response regulator transcription factor n=1 Tax=uncultured Bacteroides sp. TaxID=162156 RepID=UPI002AAB3865|nr:two-component regulator propeller domain-containing protein [uncultured Bacteroides sp.]
MKYLLFISSLFISLSYLYPSNVKFHNVNDIYGISMRETASICKDDNGFIWASSRSGIIRLGNDNYRIYHLSFNMPDVIFVKLKYANGDLLAYSNNGQIFRYNAIYDRFDFLLNMRKVLSSSILGVNRFLIDNHRDYWIATNVGLYKYTDKDSLTTVIKSRDFQSAVWYDDSHLVAATREGISLIDTHSMREEDIYKYAPGKNLDVSTLFFDKEHKRLWIGTLCDGLFYYDFSTVSLNRFLDTSFPKQPILAIESNSDSTVLVGVDGQGIWQLHKIKNKVMNVFKEDMDVPLSLSGNGVYDIFHDKGNGRVWVATITGGVSYFDQSSPLITRIVHQMNKSNSLHNNHVNQIIEDRMGNLWFATDNGISCWDVKKDQWQTYYQNGKDQAHVFLSLCEDSKGKIWCGSYSSGVYVIDEKTREEVAHYSKSKKGATAEFNFVFDIYCDSEGDVWIGSNLNAVNCYISEKRKFRQYSYYAVSAFTEWLPGKMLLACSHGLVYINKRTGESGTLLYGDVFQDLLLLGDKVWLCSSGSGLTCFDLKTKTVERFTTDSGLPSNYTNSIVYSDGYLWVGTESGLCQFNPVKKKVTGYFPFLSNDSFNRDAHCQLRNNFLAWGTNSGAVIFDPADLRQSKPKGRIFVQDILVSGRSIRDNSDFNLNVPLDSMERITLQYNQNNLTIELLPISRKTANFKFSWSMEGVDKNQTHPSDYRKLTYTNIPSGEHVLKIRMYDKFLSKIVSERSFIVSVIPPFWETWWFRFLLTALVLSLLYLFLRFYINRLKQRHTEDKVRFFANMAHEIRTTITLIKAPIEELNRKAFSKEDKYFLDIAVEQARRLSSTVTHLLDFQKADIGKEQLSMKMVDIAEMLKHRILMFESFAKSKNVNLQFSAEPDVYMAAIDRLKIETVVDNLISNAIKYSNNGSQVDISFSGDASSWILKVKDYGIGMSSKAQKKLFHEFYRSENAINSNNIGSGIGLLLAKSYVTLHGGTISCSSHEDEGSLFKITIPFKEIPIDELKSDEEIIAESEVSDKELLKLASSVSKMRLLIVEDNEELRHFMVSVLRHEFEVSIATDGEIAWQAIQKQMPDIVVSDVMMPNMDGFELCRLIKSTYETSHIPVVLLTALADKAEQLHGLGLGADNYLTKPFDMALVIQRIRSIVQNRKVLREKALKLIGENSEEALFNNELNDQFIKKAMDTVWANMINTEFSNKEFASAMNISEPLLYKKIKSLAGQTPLEFIKAVRLNHALELLKTRKHTVTEVSEMCGFSSLNYFGKAFKKHFDKSPSEI